MEGGDRGGLAERKKFAERKKILEKSRKTLDRERPSHGRTLAINCGLPAIRLECELGLGCMYPSPSARWLTLQVSPECKLWFFDGKDSKNHTVSNPTIGYGFHTIKYANGKSREFFQIGVSGNKTGISVYILGLKDKKYLAKTYGKKLGKASVTGYCIRFKALKDINIDTLEAAIRYGLAAQNEKGKLMK